MTYCSQKWDYDQGCRPFVIDAQKIVFTLWIYILPNADFFSDTTWVVASINHIFSFPNVRWFCTSYTVVCLLLSNTECLKTSDEKIILINFAIFVCVISEIISAVTIDTEYYISNNSKMKCTCSQMWVSVSLLEYPSCDIPYDVLCNNRNTKSQQNAS